MSSILDLAISISLADHISSGVKNIIGQFKLMENAAADAQKRMEGFKNMAFFGAGIGAAGALAFKGVTDAISSTTKAAMEFEDVMNNVKMAAFGKDLIDPAKTSEVKQTLDDLTTGFEKLGIATKFSDKSAAETALGMLRGGITKDFILGEKDDKGNYNYSGLTAAMYAAQLGEIDPQAAGDFIAKQKAAFNMNSGRTLQATDYYAKVAAASTMDMKSLIPGMLTASGVAGTLGMTPEDTALLVATTGTYTKDGDTAGTFTKDFLDRLIPHTKKQKEAMAELGWLKKDGSSIFFDDSGKIKGTDFMFSAFQEASKKYRPDDFQKMMHTIFMEQGKSTALALANGSEIYSDIKNNVGNQLDMYQQVDIQMKGTKNMMDSLAETWNIVKRVFGDPFLDPIKTALSGLNKVLGDFIVPWAKAHPEVIKVAAAVALGASAFLTIGGAITIGVAAFGALSTALSVAGIGLGTVALISGGVVLAIGAIAGAAYLIYKNWDRIGPYAKAVWQGLQEEIAPVVNWIKSNVAPIASSAWDGIISGLSKLGEGANKYLPMIKQILGFSKGESGEIKWKLPDWAKIIGGFLLGGMVLDKTVGGSISLFTHLGVVMRVISGINPLTWLPSMLSRLPMLFSLLTKIPGVSGIMTIARGARMIGSGLLSVLPTLTRFGSLIGRVFLGNVGTIFRFIGLIGQLGGRFVWLAGQALWMGGRMAVAWMIGLGPIGWIILGVVAIVVLLVAAWKNNWGHIREHTKETVDWIKDHFDKMVTWLQGLPARTLQAGKDFVQGFKDGINNTINLVENAVKNVSDKAVGTLKSLLGIHSPSRVMMEHGRFITQGVALGIIDQVGLVKNASAAVSDAIEVKGSGGGSGMDVVHPGQSNNGRGVVIQGPLVGEIHQQPGENADDLLERLYRMVVRRLSTESTSANLTIGSRGLQRGY